MATHCTGRGAPFKGAMMQTAACTLLLILVSLMAPPMSAIELTFEMEPHNTDCFYETVKGGVKTYFEYQVQGGKAYFYDQYG